DCKGVYNDGKWIRHGKLMETIMETPTQTPMGSESPGRGQAEGSKSTRFQPGHPGRQRGGRRHRLPSQLLRDMRFVYAQDESKDRTPGQKLCRQMLKDDPKGFFSQLAKLE